MHNDTNQYMYYHAEYETNTVVYIMDNDLFSVKCVVKWVRKSEVMRINMWWG